MQEGTEMLTAKEVAKEMKVHISTVREWVSSGKLIPTWIGKREYRISRASLNDFIRKQSSPQPPDEQ